MQIELFYYENTDYYKKFFIRRNKKISFFDSIDDLKDFKKFYKPFCSENFLYNYNKLGNFDVNKVKNKKEFIKHLVEEIINLAPELFL